MPQSELSARTPIPAQRPEQQAPAAMASAPDFIMKFFAGHLNAKYLMAAHRLGIFEALAAAPLSLESLADQTRLPLRTLRIVIRPLLNCGLLELAGKTYRNAPAAQACLAGAPGVDLRPIVAMWDRVVERQWLGFVKSLQGDVPSCGWNDLTAEEGVLFSDGIAALTSRTASAVAQLYDFSRHRSLLDLGGGTGSFLRVIGQRHQALRKSLFERPQVLKHLDQAGIELVPGDLRSDSIPANHDVYLLANVLHLFRPSENRDLLSRIRKAAASKTRLLLVDFWMDDNDQTPEFGALLAGEFLIVSGGDVYSSSQVREWLVETGWHFIEHRTLTGASSLIVAEARSDY